MATNFLLVLIPLICSLACGEYRAYLLEFIEYDSPDTGEGQARDEETEEETVEAEEGEKEPQRTISSLDPDQYPTYYPLPPGTYVRMVDSWMCPGRTHGAPPCEPSNLAETLGEGAPLTPSEPPSAR